jgi:exopolysaccharide biosynthesis polyprenyl glycosylphosphotransferase
MAMGVPNPSSVLSGVVASTDVSAQTADDLESAVSPSTYAVPQRLLWLTDAAIQLLALPLAWHVAPLLRPLLAAERAGRMSWLRWLDFQPAAAASLAPLADVAWIPLVSAPATLLFMRLVGGYRPLLEQARTRVVVASLLAPMAGLSLVTLALITVRNFGTSRSLMFLFTAFTAAGFLASRWAIRLYKHRRLLAGCYTRNVIVVAPPAARRWLFRHFADRVSPQVRRLVGYLEMPDVPLPPGTGAATNATADGEPPRLGGVDALGELLIHRPIHEVVAVQGAGSDAWLQAVIEQCEYFHVTLRLIPELLLSSRLPALDLTCRTGPLGLPEVELRPRYLDDEALFLKRMFDIVVSAALLVLLAPLFAVVAVVIKLTTPRLPVFYPWRVIGYKGRPFTGYKFTTMVADADDRKAGLMHLNEMTGPVFKIKDDPRMTPVGRWLRRFSLNELPQLWSVLRGDMSLVGPRPAYPTELARYELWQKRKLCVQPGITCLWQIRGRNRISNFDDWVRMDFEYIDNWSLWLDCRILARTALAVLRGTGS